jgi:hypothetical protein
VLPLPGTEPGSPLRKEMGIIAERRPKAVNQIERVLVNCHCTRGVVKARAKIGYMAQLVVNKYIKLGHRPEPNSITMIVPQQALRAGDVGGSVALTTRDSKETPGSQRLTASPPCVQFSNTPLFPRGGTKLPKDQRRTCLGLFRRTTARACRWAGSRTSHAYKAGQLRSTRASA